MTACVPISALSVGSIWYSISRGKCVRVSVLGCAIVLALLLHTDCGRLAAQEYPDIPSEKKLEELWQYAVRIGKGNGLITRPDVRLVELDRGAALAVLDKGEVHLHPVHAFSGVPHIEELYLAHEFLHFVLYYQGIPAAVQHCWMARKRTETTLTYDFLDRVGQYGSLRRSMLRHATYISWKWRQQCQDTSRWWHPRVLRRVDQPPLAN